LLYAEAHEGHLGSTEAQHNIIRGVKWPTDCFSSVLSQSITSSLRLIEP